MSSEIKAKKIISIKNYDMSHLFFCLSVVLGSGFPACLMRTVRI